MSLDLTRARELVAKESGLSVAVVYRADGSAATSVVNAGVLAHPVTGQQVLAFVVRGHAKKLRHLRRNPRTTVVIRAGWEWVAVEGTVELAGPGDRVDGFAIEQLPHLLRSVYAAAVGGTPEDWTGLDAEMKAEGHTAALLSPSRVYGSQ